MSQIVFRSALYTGFRGFTGNLDSTTGAQVLELLLELNRNAGTTLVLVTHDAELAGHADRIVTLKDGRVIGDRQREGRAGV